MTVAARVDAIATLEEGHARLGELLDGVGDADLERPGSIGGGDWSAKDLLGHIASWEEIALDSLAQWRRDERPAIEDVFAEEGVDRLNAENVERKAGQTPAVARSRADATHRSLVSEIAGLTDEEWREKAPYRTERRASLGTLLGSILGAPQRPFGHAFAHLPDLEAYVTSVRTRA